MQQPPVSASAATIKTNCTNGTTKDALSPCNTEALEKLILPGNQKQVIHSLVHVHAGNLLQFDEVIAGKGKGMVFLLHGESGTGKTLTAGTRIL